MLLCARGDAHPFLQGGIRLTIGKESVVLRLRETLRPAVLSAHAKPRHGAFFSEQEIKELVTRHADYLAAHLELRNGTKLLRASTLVAEPAEALTHPVHPLVDLENLHAVYELEYRLDSPLDLISLEQTLFDDLKTDEVWQTTYVVGVVYAGRENLVASGVLSNESGFEFKQASSTSHADQVAASRVSFFGFVRAGIEHILLGWDHLLFVAALVLVARRWLDVIKVVLAFTLAHSLTLTLAATSVLRLPGWLIEPLIALSIVVVSALNLLQRDALTSRARLAMGFGFGLVHGLGFAGPLVDALERATPVELAKGILAFSLGVEIGHQLVILPLATFTLWAVGRGDGIRQPLVRIGSVLIALGGLLFLVRAL
jgi:hypothetical protein